MPLIIIILLLIGIPIYFFPSLVAHSRKHPNLTSLFVLNLLLGWTILGWVGTLAWAYSKKHEVIVEIKSTSQADTQDVAMTKKCPFCAEEVRVEAIKCKHCGSDLSKSSSVETADPHVIRSGRVN